MRSTGAQTIVPPSTHPSGEAIAFEAGGRAPASVDAALLTAQVSKLAAACLLARHSPPEGGRHDYRNAIAGGLTRAGWNVEDITAFIRHVCLAASHADLDDVETAARTARERHRAGTRFTGWSTVARLIGDQGKGVVARATGWLAISNADGEGSLLDAVTDPQPAPKVTSTPPPPPIPLDAPIPPELPSTIFTGWFGDTIDSVSAAMETPPELAAAFGLGVLSTVVQQRFSTRIKQGYFEPLNTWPLCALPPGMRKTGVMLEMTAPLLEWERRQAATYLPRIEAALSERKSAEARIGWLRDQAKKAKVPEEFQRQAKEVADLEASLPEIPTCPILFSQDVTPEHTGTLLAQNGERLSLVSDEAGLFDILAGRYSNGIPNLDVFLQSHAGAMVKVHRGSRPPVVLRHPTLTVCLSPQPEVLKGLTSKPGFRGRGLLARFMYMVPTSRLGFRSGDGPAVPEAIAAAYRDAVLSLADVQPNITGDRQVPHVLFFAEESLDRWQAFWLEVEGMMREGGALMHLTDWGGKLPGLTARIAGLLHLADFASEPLADKTIRPQTIDRAILFSRYLIEHARIAFGVMGADADLDAARHLWDAVTRRRLASFTARDAWQMVRGRYPKMGDVEGAFDVLVDHALALEPHQADDDMPRRRGRPPARRFIVNPLVVSGWAGGEL